MYLFLMALFSIILILLLVVGIHEAAHALMARLFGIKIKRISIGFGKPLLRWQKKGCEWVFAMIPLGGYVHMLNTRIEPVEAKDYPVCFDKKPVWMRILVLLAGSITNIIFAFLLLVLVFSVGLQEPAAVVGEVMPDSIAAKAGMQSGDKIVEIAGKSVLSWREAGMRMIAATGQAKLAVSVQNSAGKEQVLSLDLHLPKVNHDSLIKALGIIPDENAPIHMTQATNFLDACRMAIQFIYETCGFMLQVLWLIIARILPISLLIGPLGMFSLTIATFMEGLIAFLFFTANFSIAVGLANLFPVPGLDGGSILYALIEKIRGKPVSVAMEILLYRFAMIFAGILLVQLLVNDLS